jgi:hypothetical protein
MAFDFPSTPTEGQTFTDTASGARYVYKNGVWMQVSSSMLRPGSLDLLQDYDVTAGASTIEVDYLTGWPVDYDQFTLELNRMQFANNCYMFMRTKETAAGTIVNGAGSYLWTLHMVGPSGASAGEGHNSGTNGGDTLMQLSRCGTAPGVAAVMLLANSNFDMNWRIRFPNPTRQSAFPRSTPFIWEGTMYESSLGIANYRGSCSRAGSVLITGLRVQPIQMNGSGTTMTGGHVKLWGRHI